VCSRAHRPDEPLPRALVSQLQQLQVRRGAAAHTIVLIRCSQDLLPDYRYSAFFPSTTPSPTVAPTSAPTELPTAAPTATATGPPARMSGHNLTEPELWSVNITEGPYAFVFSVLPNGTALVLQVDSKLNATVRIGAAAAGRMAPNVSELAVADGDECLGVGPPVKFRTGKGGPSLAQRSATHRSARRR
jgi:hypothetical protein